MINELADRLSRFSVPFSITVKFFLITKFKCVFEKVAESDLHKKTLWDARSKLDRSLAKASEQNKTVTYVRNKSSVKKI